MWVKSLSFTTNHILIHHPRGAIKIKKTYTHKKGSRRQLKACTPTEQQTRRLGTLGRLTDSSAEQGHNCPRGCTLHSCLGFVCNKANTDKSEGDKLKEGRASEATRQRWRMMVVYGCRASCLSLPVICREWGACVPFLFWQSRLHFFHRKNTLKCLHLYCLLNFTAVHRIHLWCLLIRESRCTTNWFYPWRE